jgi:hypothetical protein
MAGGIITTGAHPKALWPGVKGWWGNVYNEFQTEYKELVDEVTSDKAYEDVVEDTGFSLGALKSQGGSITYDANLQGYTSRAIHVTYALGYIVTMEELMDNQYEAVSRVRARANAFSMRQTKEVIVANLYNNAFTSGYTGGDGVVLCSTAHPVQGGATQANRPAVDTDLSIDALEDAIIDIHGTLNAKGLRIQVKPWKLIVPRQMWFEANRILQSVYQPGGANNDINAVKMTNAMPGGVVMNHYLTAAGAWFIRTDIRGEQGLALYNRMPVQFDQDNDFDTKNAKAASIERYSVVWADWRAIYGVNGP